MAVTGYMVKLFVSFYVVVTYLCTHFIKQHDKKYTVNRLMSKSWPHKNLSTRKRRIIATIFFFKYKWYVHILKRKQCRRNILECNDLTLVLIPLPRQTVLFPRNHCSIHLINVVFKIPWLSKYWRILWIRWFWILVTPLTQLC